MVLFENNIDKVNLFPINVKPYTLLYELYEKGKYFPVSYKEFNMNKNPEKRIELPESTEQFMSEKQQEF